MIFNTKLPILISFSGGRTSAFMTKFFFEYSKYLDNPKIVLFANTGKELKCTLDFVDECDRRWGLNVNWIEVDVNPTKGKGGSPKLVNYKSASMNGEPFDAVVKKYGIPNNQFPHCTRELKVRPMHKFMRKWCKDNGYNDYYTAVGFRKDEEHRVSRKAEARNPIYPLVDDIQVDVGFIRNFWGRQEFDLGTFVPRNILNGGIGRVIYEGRLCEVDMGYRLNTNTCFFSPMRDYEGNCDLCWKKSKRKRLTLIKEVPGIEISWQEWESKYRNKLGRPFDRDGHEISELKQMSDNGEFNLVTDDFEYDPEMDTGFECFCESSI